MFICKVWVESTLYSNSKFIHILFISYKFFDGINIVLFIFIFLFLSILFENKKCTPNKCYMVHSITCIYVFNWTRLREVDSAETRINTLWGHLWKTWSDGNLLSNNLCKYQSLSSIVKFWVEFKHPLRILMNWTI